MTDHLPLHAPIGPLSVTCFLNKCLENFNSVSFNDTLLDYVMSFRLV